MHISPFHRARMEYAPGLPECLATLIGQSFAEDGPAELSAPPDQIDMLQALFPRTFHNPVLLLGGGESAPVARLEAKKVTAAVVLSGGQAPGGHNVIWGLVEGLASLSSQCSVLGFHRGPQGILDDKATLLTCESIAEYRNTGGFDLLGSGRTKLETPEQFAKCRAVLEARGVDCLVVIGGDDSNTNAACLAEYLLAHGSKVRVIGVPKTIDGDLKNRYVETSFGFDTAVRVYAELIANISRDTLSARKYYHFIRLMGRSASHITLEAALQTQPNVALVSEDIAARRMTLRDVVKEVGDLIKRRAAKGLNYGVVLVPEGLVEFIPEVKSLIKELNQILVEHKDYLAKLTGFPGQSEYIHHKLSKDGSATFSSMPIDIQRELLMERDPHGNVQVSRIETEKLLIGLLETYLAKEKGEGRYTGKFGWQHHFLGYEGRCAAPTNFDADYSYALGRTASALVAAGGNNPSITGYMAVVGNLTGPRSDWRALGVPLVPMMNLETRKGKATPVIKKALVELDGKAFRHFAAARDAWAVADHYRFAGPIQYFGPKDLCDRVPLSLALDQGREKGCAW